jgi:nitroreductase
METNRKSEHPISPIILNRWSPRAMSSEALSDEELLTLFEAARWAPSSSNIQPWRFIYAKRDTPEFEKFFRTLVEFNQLWTKNAAVLVCIIAKKTNDKGDLNPNNKSDSGAAWENLAIQASISNIVCHGMAGFDSEKARSVMKIPDDFDVIHMFALGKPASPDVLPERMQKSEVPSDRKPLSDLIFQGKFKQE